MRKDNKGQIEVPIRCKVDIGCINTIRDMQEQIDANKYFEDAIINIALKGTMPIVQEGHFTEMQSFIIKKLMEKLNIE